MSTNNETSVIVVAENTLVREGIRRILGDAFHVTDSLESSALLLDRASHGVTPELIIFDNGNANDLCVHVDEVLSYFPNAHIVILADIFRFEQMVEAFRTGARGYIIKQIACESLIGSLRLVALGEKVMPSAFVDHLPLAMTPSSSASTPDITDLQKIFSEREVQILRYLFRGCPNKIIAYQLDISEATVKVHVKSILRKLRVQNRTQAAIWAVNHGIDFTAPEIAGSYAVAG
jgi:two-component system nitrate/nitrite response regulator NarL